MLNSAVSLPAMRTPNALARLLNISRVAFLDGPASLPFAKLTDATIVDLVAVDWQRVAQRIVDDLARAPCALGESSVFHAAAALRVPLSHYRHRD